MRNNILATLIALLSMGSVFAQNIEGSWKLTDVKITPVSPLERSIPTKETVVWRDVIKNNLILNFIDGNIQNFSIEGKAKNVKYEISINNTLRIVFLDNIKENKISYTEYKLSFLPNNLIQLKYEGRYATEIYSFIKN